MFYKKVNYDSNKEMFEFLTNHFTYDTLNSWNMLKSIANKVKVYSLDLKNEPYDVLEAIQEDDYFSINMALKDWEGEHPGYKLGFNGRSGGYLVLYNDDNNAHCFDRCDMSPCKYDSYEDWKSDVIYYYGSLNNYHDELVKQVKLVQDFDKLCDDLVELCDSLTYNYFEIKNNTVEFEATKLQETYTYKDKLQMDRHKCYMKAQGCTIAEENDLTCIYNINQICTGEVYHPETILENE